MYGLVFEGGGSKGAYQIGACKALSELGVTYRAVAGTSVGALNGVMVVQDRLDRAYELWHDINPYNVIKMTEEELSGFEVSAAGAEGLNTFMKNFRKVVVERGLDTSPLVEMLKNEIDEAKVRSSPVDFGIVTIDLTGRKALEIYKEDIPEGKLVDYILASASFPAFRRAVIDGRVFIDGGFYNALPINLVKNKGCRDIIVLRTNTLGIKRRFDTAGLNIITIEPYDGLGPILDFNSRRTQINLKLGYFDAIKVFRRLKGRRYYVLPEKDEGFFINYLASLPESKVKRLCGLFGLESCSLRTLFECLVPRVSDLLGLPANSSYEDVCIGLLEKMAEAKGVERFKIYAVDELFSEIAGGYEGLDEEFMEEIPGFLKTQEFLTRLISDRIISSIANIIFCTDV